MTLCEKCIHGEICADRDCMDIDDERALQSCNDFKNKADFVEVVRCKDCDIPHNKWTGCPYMNGLIPPPNHFCSYGERKTVTDTNVGGK